MSIGGVVNLALFRCTKHQWILTNCLRVVADGKVASLDRPKHHRETFETGNENWRFLPCSNGFSRPDAVPSCLPG